MSKLHSFSILFFFLICGQLACGDTESAANGPGLARSDAATGTSTDAASVRDGAAQHSDAAVTTSDSFRADASAGGAAGGAAGSTGAEDGGVSEPAAEAPYGSFSHIYEVAFRTCRTQCHVMGFSMLNMATRESAYAALVDQDSNPNNMNCAPSAYTATNYAAGSQNAAAKRSNAPLARWDLALVELGKSPTGADCRDSLGPSTCCIRTYAANN